MPVVALSQLRKVLAPVLEELSNTDPAWAVFFSYYHDTMTTQIHEVTPWDYEKHRVRTGLLKVYAKDEMDAYMRVMREMEQKKCT